jgi:hypothetical protein
LEVNLDPGRLLDFRSSVDRVLDTQVNLGRELNDSRLNMLEAVGIEEPGAHPIRTMLERFRGQISKRTRPKNTSKTDFRTFS